MSEYCQIKNTSYVKFMSNSTNRTIFIRNKPIQGVFISMHHLERKQCTISADKLYHQVRHIHYSLIEMAKEMGLDPYQYLKWVFGQAPTLAVSDERWAEKLTPANAPEELKIPQ